MKTIVHISDMHFGRSDPAINDALLAACRSISPDLFVISGDFTQHATTAQFEQARTFLEKLGYAKQHIIAIPGNHDIEPLYKPIARIRRPYDRYREYIEPYASDRYADADVAIGSINTVRAARLVNGRVSMRNITDAEAWFRGAHSQAVRLLVTHHPLDLPAAAPRRKLVRSAKRGVYRLSKSRIDMYLSGHYHRSSAVVTKARYPKDHYAAIALQAGTVSLRSRGQVQSFNLLRITREKIEICIYLWNESKEIFQPSETLLYRFEEGNGWV